MSENQKKILEMLAEGKIKVEEAQRLLSLVDSGRSNDTGSSGATSKSVPRYLYVVVEPKAGASSERKHSRVNVRVPFGLIKAGMKLTALMPAEAAEKVNAAMREKGMDFDLRRLKYEDIEELVIALRDSHINVDTDDETVRIYAE
jgi:hypothetical protein